jgi:protein-disulfide isomerase
VDRFAATSEKRLRVKSLLRLAAILGLCALASAAHAQQSPAAAPSPLQKTIESYLRNLYAFGPDVKVSVGEPKDSPVAGLLETNIDVTIGENKQSVKFFVSKDGRYLFQGEMSDLTKDPTAENRARIQLKDSPTLGDPKAPVTLVEYSDFECPVCRNLHDALRGLLPNYPQVRVVFKDFPLEQIHPWARTAALAGRCAYNQDPKAFWKVYDLIYDNQEVISAENAWAKMLDYAGQANLNVDTFKSCMASPDAGAAIDASRINGQQLEVNSTPTIFVNGRRIVGADPHALEQYIKYELATRKAAASSDKK